MLSKSICIVMLMSLILMSAFLIHPVYASQESSDSLVVGKYARYRLNVRFSNIHFSEFGIPLAGELVPPEYVFRLEKDFSYLITNESEVEFYWEVKDVDYSGVYLEVLLRYINLLKVNWLEDNPLSGEILEENVTLRFNRDILVTWDGFIYGDGRWLGSWMFWLPSRSVGEEALLLYNPFPLYGGSFSYKKFLDYNSSYSVFKTLEEINRTSYSLYGASIRLETYELGDRRYIALGDGFVNFIVISPPPYPVGYKYGDIFVGGERIAYYSEPVNNGYEVLLERVKNKLSNLSNYFVFEDDVFPPLILYPNGWIFFFEVIFSSSVYPKNMLYDSITGLLLKWSDDDDIGQMLVPLPVFWDEVFGIPTSIVREYSWMLVDTNIDFSRPSIIVGPDTEEDEPEDSQEGTSETVSNETISIPSNNQAVESVENESRVIIPTKEKDNVEGGLYKGNNLVIVAATIISVSLVVAAILKYVRKKVR